MPAEDEHYYGRIYLHRLGDSQRDDRLVFETPGEKEVIPLVEVSCDGRSVVIVAQRGASDEGEIYAHRRVSGNERPRRLFTGFDAVYAFIQAVDGRLFFRTTEDAPFGRIVAVDLGRAEADVKPSTAALLEIVAETSDRLSGVVLTRDRLVAIYLHNASDELRLFTLTGARWRNCIAGDRIDTSVDGEPDSDRILFTFVSFSSPPVSYRYAGGQL